MGLGEVNIYYLMIGFSVTIILSYFFNYVSKVTRVPSVILLIATGYLSSVLLPDSFLNVMPYLELLGSIGIILIVLEAALDLELEKGAWKLLGKAILSAAVLLAVNATIAAYTISTFYSVPIQSALAYGIPLAIMSSAIIIPSVSHLIEDKKEFLIYEASFSDILGIMVFYFLLDSTEMESIGQFSLHILGNIGLTLLIAVLLGYFTILLILRVKSKLKLFLPIAVLILLYSIGKLFHLSSLIFILVFGLMANNRHLFFWGRLYKLLHLEQFEDTLQEIKTNTLETSFVIRTFFFIVFGMTITLTGLNEPRIYLVTLIILAALYLSRFGVLKLIQKETMLPALYVAPRGLITILLFFSIPPSMEIESFSTGILLLVIIGSNLIMTFGLMRHPDAEQEKEKNTKDTENTEATESSDPESGTLPNPDHGLHTDENDPNGAASG